MSNDGSSGMGQPYSRLQCSDSVGWATASASDLPMLSDNSICMSTCWRQSSDCS